MEKIKTLFKAQFNSFSTRDIIIYALCMMAIILTYSYIEPKDILCLITGLVGCTGLLFIAKGKVLGSFITVAFSIFYGIVSFFLALYGEVISYLCMTTPMAIITVVTWLKNQAKDSDEVAVRKLKVRDCIIGILLTAGVTVAFYFILSALNTTNIIFSTISIATSFSAVYLTALRSKYYAFGYIANDIVLIIIWTMATIEDLSKITMIVCFVSFLVLDCYSFYEWHKMHKRQNDSETFENPQKLDE